jgi:cell division septation protein DedD
LVVAKPWQGPPHPHEKEDKEKYLDEQRYGTQYSNGIVVQPQVIHEGKIITAEIECGNYSRRNKHIDVFREQVKPELHAAIFSMVPSYQFGFALW